MDLSDKHEPGWLSELVRDLRSAAAGHDPLLVGALARDLLLHFGSGVAIQRATTDVDLAFAVANWNEFELLRGALLSSGRFTATASAEHRLRHLGTLRVDIIPFGGVEDSAGRIEWPGDQGLIRVLGYREARATSLDIRLPGGRRISTASPAMLAVIKAIAWADRHASQPRKDAGDLLLILRNYLTDRNAQRFYEEGARLLESDDFDYEADERYKSSTA